MEQWNNAWNYQVPEEKKRSVKYRAAKALVWFLAFMVSATLLSRAADGLTVAAVKTENPRRSTVSQKIETDGRLELSGGKPVPAPSGVYVKEVAVKNGQEVAAGDFLFSYDTKSFREKIQSLELDIQTLNARAAEEKKKTQTEQDKVAKEKEKGIDRKEKDLETLEIDFELRSRSLQQRIQAAKVALSKYDSIGRGQYDDVEFTEGEYETLRANYRALLFEQEQLENEKQKALQDVVRSIEDLEEKEESAETSSRLQELEIQKIRLELSQLYGQVANEGLVYAPSDGIVTDIKVETGVAIPGETALFLTQKSGLTGKATITKEQKKRLAVGDQMTFTPYGEREGYKNLTVESMEPNVANPTDYDVQISLGELDLPPGTGGTFSFSKKSQTYDTCVPLSALYSEGNQSYVLVLDETQTTLGTEKVARRVDVTVQEKNDTLAAVTGALLPEDQVIISTDKPVSGGGRVRLEKVS